MSSSCSPDTTETTTTTASAAAERAYVVSGMTCAHCVASVQEEVSEIDGVEVVSLDLVSGRLVVSGAAADSQDAIRAAVEAAGYTVAPA
jgi:copper chaperone CopZ